MNSDTNQCIQQCSVSINLPLRADVTKIHRNKVTSGTQTLPIESMYLQLYRNDVFGKKSEMV